MGVLQPPTSLLFCMALLLVGQTGAISMVGGAHHQAANEQNCPLCGQNEQNCDNVHQCTSNCGQIRSSNYPNNYANNHRCRWSLRAPNTHYVNLTVVDFDIPSTNNATKLGSCIFDYLTLIDGYSGKRIGCYCNDNLPPTHIVSPWNELIIQFDTNSDITGRGFNFEYKFMRLELAEHIWRQMRPYKPPAGANISPSGLATNISTNSNISISTTTSNINMYLNNNNLNFTRSLTEMAVLNASSSDQVCLPGWQYFRSNCYKAFHELEPLQWYDAENKCNNVHGLGLDSHLVSILDKDEMLVIQYMMTNVWQSQRYQDYYIGLIDVTREGVYRWSDNNPMSYTDWQLAPLLLEEELLAQPDGGAYEDCTIIRFNSYSHTSNWHDVPCSLGKHYHQFVAINNQQQVHNNYINNMNSNLQLQLQLQAQAQQLQQQQLQLQQQQLQQQQALLAGGVSDASARYANSLRWDYVSSYICKSDSISAGSMGVARGYSSRKRLFPLPLAANLSSPNALTANDTRYFVCDNSERISVVLRCDGIAHCRDGSDESSGCDQDCFEWQFKCANGRCIPIGSYCDFVDDCGDASDESRCERARCKLNEFRCQSGQCIRAEQRCDLIADCSDGSDEGKLCTFGRNCHTASTFQCYNGNCIPHYAVCDFQIDCPGKFHEDEDKATCELVLQSRSAEFKRLESASFNSSLSNTTNQTLAAQPKTTASTSPSFRCTSGNLVESRWRCLYEFDRYGYQLGCRDVSHLIGCESFECPGRDYVKCSSSYCIPWRYICDGKWDCMGGEDELGCARYVCPNEYKCANQSSCILAHQLCDGHRQCPMGDDEWFCELSCPSQCQCIGLSVDCRNAGLTALGGPQFVSRAVRKLDLSHNRLGPNLSQSDFSGFHDLGELILHHNHIEQLTPRTFNQLRNLYKLDLSYNQIRALKRGAFAGLRRVTQLLLESNPELEFLEPEAFLGLSSLQVLNISCSRILNLKKNTFDGLTSLRQLQLRNNMIVEIEDGAFRSLISLVSLDMRGNDIRYFTKMLFSDLKSLRKLSTDSFKFCCLVANQISSDRCLPPPDEISDCEDLLSSVLQRTCIWAAGVVSVVGNSLVIYWRYRKRVSQKEREDQQVNSTLLLSLGVSDLLMGIYLLIIANADNYYRGIYIENSDNWRESILCNICGLLSTVSSIVSVLTLVTIAYNRFTVVCGPFPSKFTLSYTHKLIMASWFTAIAIATLPLIIKSYFEGAFYTRSGVCLAFHITNQKPPGWLYSIVVFQGLNLVAFVIIVRCYLLMYREISRSRRPNLHLKILLILVTSFLAWSPTIILRLMSLAGIALPAAVYSWIAVLVLPVNSAINPLIYTIPNIRRQIRHFFHAYRARKSGALSSMRSTTNNQSNGSPSIEMTNRVYQPNQPNNN